MDRTAKEPTNKKTDNSIEKKAAPMGVGAAATSDGGPRYKDQVSSRARVAAAPSAPEDEARATDSNKKTAALMGVGATAADGGPRYKDQVSSRGAPAVSAPEDEERGDDGNNNTNNSGQAPPAAGDFPNFKDQAGSAAPSSSNYTPARLGAVRVVPPGAAAAAEEEEDHDSLPNDEESLVRAPGGDGDPSLINAVLVDDGNNKSILQAEVVVHNKWRRILILVIVMAVVLAVGIVAGVLSGGGKGDGGDEDDAPAPSPPTLAPTEATPSCPLDFNVDCSLPEDFIIPFMPCSDYRRPIEFSNTTCMHRPIAASLLFNGGNCSDSDNQQLLNFTCSDFNGGPPSSENFGEEAFISVIDNAGAGAVLFEGLVPVGEVLSLYNNGDEFGDFQQIRISSPDRSVILEEVLLSLTCSSDVEFANRYGALQTVGYYNEEQGSIVALISTTTYVDLLVTAVLVPNTGVESVALTNLSVTVEDFVPPQDITESLPEEATADSQNAIQFPGGVSVDSLSLRSYRIDFSYEGLSTSGDDTALCTGTDSVSFVFGLFTTR